MSDEKITNITDFLKLKNSKQETLDDEKVMDDEIKALLNQGLEVLTKEITENGEGFIGIVFNKDNPTTPNFVWAGAIEPTVAIGMLELIKHDFLQTATQYQTVFSEDDSE